MTEQRLHPIFGISRPDGEWPRRCSKCDQEIPEDAVPLMLWADKGRVMWVVCHRCSDPLLKRTAELITREEKN